PQIALVETFADQAVIAIENARLFQEVQTRTRELAKTVEDLEIASQHKAQFVANMNHKLRTPLAAMLGFAELIQEGFYEPQGPKSLDALTRIRSNGKHLLGLTIEFRSRFVDHENISVSATFCNGSAFLRLAIG